MGGVIYGHPCLQSEVGKPGRAVALAAGWQGLQVLHPRRGHRMAERWLGRHGVRLGHVWDNESGKQGSCFSSALHRLPGRPSCFFSPANSYSHFKAQFSLS
jgi:hypothetical protein